MYCRENHDAKEAHDVHLVKHLEGDIHMLAARIRHTHDLHKDAGMLMICCRQPALRCNRNMTRIRATIGDCSPQRSCADSSTVT